MRFLKTLLHFLIFLVLTILTQIGGIVYLLSRLTLPRRYRLHASAPVRAIVKITYFLLLYALAVFFLVPLLARPLGRVPLPLSERNGLRPLNLLTCFLNRHYVKPGLKDIALRVAQRMHEKHPGTVVNYLDANFPFMDRFPLIPHLSHNDGKKLDLSFCYLDAKTGSPVNTHPSFIGYGICEEPRNGEEDKATYCASQGYWQYSLMKALVPQSPKQNFTFDEVRTKDLIRLFAFENRIGKIFIEPHLKARMKLSDSKVRFHGCQAVRHDDHIHVQMSE